MYATKTFATCNEGVRITGKVFVEGPLGVVLFDKLPDATSQYPDNKRGYLSVYLFDRPYGRISERHSHGYGVDFLDYFKGIVNFRR